MNTVLFINEMDVETAWLKAVCKVLMDGNVIQTEYGKPGERISKDATVTINVKDPFLNPVKVRGKPLVVKTNYGNEYNIYGFPGDIFLMGSIQSGYIEEIMEGRLNHKIGSGLDYTYNDRLFNYSAYSYEDYEHIKYFLPRCDHFDDAELNDIQLPRIDQINEYVIPKLKGSGFSRRVQATTWRPYSDTKRSDGPCLQRVWFRVIDGHLTMEATWRSRDLFKAWEANVNGMLAIFKYVAEELNVETGNYVDFCNSLHIYQRDFKAIKDMFERMVKRDEIPLYIYDMVKFFVGETEYYESGYLDFLINMKEDDV